MVKKYGINIGMLLYLASLILVLLVNNKTALLKIEVFFLIIGLIAIYKKAIPNFTYWIFFISLTIRLFIIAVIKTTPTSDFQLLYGAAQQAAQGNFEFGKEGYFAMWAYQTGFVLFEAVILKFFDSIWALKFVNCLLGAGITVLIYKTVLLLWKDEKAAQLISIIYAFFPFHVIHITVLTNSHVSAFFFYLGLYLLLKHIENRKANWFIIVAICLAIGNIMRPEGIIFITTIIVFYLFKICANFSKESIRKFLKQLLVILVVYLAVLNIADASIRISGINSNGLKNNNPLWKFVLGTNYVTEGQYSEEDLVLILDKQKEYDIIKERISSKIDLIDLMVKKITHFWWDPAFYWSYSTESLGKLKETVETINASLFWGMLMLSIFSTVRLKKAENMEALLFPIIIFITFMVYLLIEVQARYVYLVQIAVFIYGGYGIKCIKDKMEIKSSN